jgi:hypothetical protein
MVNKDKKVTFKASLMPLGYWGYYTRKKSDWKGLLGLAGGIDYFLPHFRHNNSLVIYYRLDYNDRSI